jgi:hypothetical protein
MPPRLASWSMTGVSTIEVTITRAVREALATCRKDAPPTTTAPSPTTSRPASAAACPWEALAPHGESVPAVVQSVKTAGPYFTHARLAVAIDPRKFPPTPGVKRVTPRPKVLSITAPPSMSKAQTLRHRNDSVPRSLLLPRRMNSVITWAPSRALN